MGDLTQSTEIIDSEEHSNHSRVPLWIYSLPWIERIECDCLPVAEHMLEYKVRSLDYTVSRNTTCKETFATFMKPHMHALMQIDMVQGMLRGYVGPPSCPDCRVQCAIETRWSHDYSIGKAEFAMIS